MKWGLAVVGAAIITASAWWYFAVWDTAQNKCNRGDLGACVVAAATVQQHTSPPATSPDQSQIVAAAALLMRQRCADYHGEIATGGGLFFGTGDCVVEYEGTKFAVALAPDGSWDSQAATAAQQRCAQGAPFVYHPDTGICAYSSSRH